MQPADDDRDDPLRAAWLGQAAPPAMPPDLAGRLDGHRRRRLALRALEALVSVGAIAGFAASALGGGFTPIDWLLLPFFAAYLPLVWWAVLRDDGREAHVLGDSRRYAAERLAQLRRSMHEAWLARRATDALLAYALLALAVVALAGWRVALDDACWVLGMAVLAWIGTRLGLRPARRRWWRERLALRRLERDLAG